MECSCKHKSTIFKHRTDKNIFLTFSSCHTLKTHELFHSRIMSLLKTKKEIQFFEKDHPDKPESDRAVLLHASEYLYKHENICGNCHRTSISLMEMEINHVHEDQQLPVWIVTQPQPTNTPDGTIYCVVRDIFGFHVRLVISNWSYVTPTKEFKSREELLNILDELLPINSMIKLFDPLLTQCHIDDELTLRCDTPNSELILTDRIKQCFILDKLDDLRDRGNQAYNRGDNLLAWEYYSFAINRIIAMGDIIISKDNECEMNLFQNAFQHDLARFHSNRSACYLREHLYPGANLDSLVVVTGRFCHHKYDEFFLKCLYRLICANIALQEFTNLLDGFFRLAENSTIQFHLRMKYSSEFQQLEKHLLRLKCESQHGKYDLLAMFQEENLPAKTFFDINLFHSDYRNTSLIKNRHGEFYAKCSIPSGTLLLVQDAFAFVKSGEYDQRRLLNEIERHLLMARSVWEFDLIRIMPLIEQWFQNETDADENDPESYPNSLPWDLLVQTQENNPFRSKSIVGWWPQASIFKVMKNDQQKANCLWFIIGKRIFLFNYLPINKNEELILANDHQMERFLRENEKHFIFLLGHNNKLSLEKIFHQLEQTQIYFHS